ILSEAKDLSLRVNSAQPDGKRHAVDGQHVEPLCGRERRERSEPSASPQGRVAHPFHNTE
ncbi:MAG: hypothetical protein ACRD24_02545, partial [Terriglobales bacterium]